MRISTVLAAGLTTLTLAALTACSQEPAQPEQDSPYTGSDVTGAFTLPDTTFTDDTGEDYNLREDSAGTTTAVFFGFTNCPDICPTTMADMAQAVDKLDKQQREKFQVVFVTADPDRDDPKLLNTWLESFDPSFTGLSGSIKKTDATAEDLGVSIDRPKDREGNYNVRHGSQILVFSPKGESELMWKYGTEPADIADDVTTLLKKDA